MTKLQWLNVALTVGFGLVVHAPITKTSLKSLVEKNGKLMEYKIKCQYQR
jgi:hypothetical protein